MLITKIIEIGLNVRDPINVYVDKDNILRILEDKLLNKCHRGCFIEKIIRVIKSTPCVINQDGSPGFGTIGVIIEVLATIYKPGEIINGCVVTNKDKNGIIICSTDKAYIMLNAHNVLESVQRDQTISVRVGAASYKIGSPRVAVSAIPYLLNSIPIVFKVTPVVNQVLLEETMSKVKEEEEIAAGLKKSDEKLWNYFDMLLYAYKTEQKTPAGAKTLNVIELATKGIPNGITYLSRDPRINLSTPHVYGFSDLSSIPPNAIIRPNLDVDNVTILMLEDYYNHLRTIREMMTIYGNPAMIESHKNLWLIFRKSKS